jgi:hypothetical protein
MSFSKTLILPNMHLQESQIVQNMRFSEPEILHRTPVQCTRITDLLQHVFFKDEASSKNVFTVVTDCSDPRFFAACNYINHIGYLFQHFFLRAEDCLQNAFPWITDYLQHAFLRSKAQILCSMPFRRIPVCPQPACRRANYFYRQAFLMVTQTLNKWAFFQSYSQQAILRIAAGRVRPLEPSRIQPPSIRRLCRKIPPLTRAGTKKSRIFFIRKFNKNCVSSEEQF